MNSSAVKAEVQKCISGQDINNIEGLLRYLCKKVDTLSTSNFPRWMDIKATCEYSSLSKNTLMEYILNGDIYGKKAGGKWLVDKESIDSFMLGDMKKLEVKKLQILRAIG